MKNKKIKFLNACLGIGTIILSSCFAASYVVENSNKTPNQTIVNENSNSICDLEESDQLSKEYTASSNPIPVSYLNISDGTLLGFVGNPTEPPTWLTSDYTSLIIPASVTCIAENAFSYNTPGTSTWTGLINANGLEIDVSFEKHSKCYSISAYSFEKCNSIVSFNGNNASKLEFQYGKVYPDRNPCAFWDCKGLTTVDLSKCINITKLEDAFGSCSNIAEFHFPPNITSLNCNSDSTLSKIHVGWTKEKIDDPNFNISSSTSFAKISSNATIYLRGGVTKEKFLEKFSILPDSWKADTLTWVQDTITPDSVNIEWTGKSTTINSKVNVSGESEGILSATLAPYDATGNVTWSVDDGGLNAISIVDNKICWSQIPTESSYDFTVKATYDGDADINPTKDFTLQIGRKSSTAASLGLGLAIGIGIPLTACLVCGSVFYVKTRKEKQQIV